jgi:hypothetical protein
VGLQMLSQSPGSSRSAPDTSIEFFGNADTAKISNVFEIKTNSIATQDTTRQLIEVLTSKSNPGDGRS